jgi:hypothetical protein
MVVVLCAGAFAQTSQNTPRPGAASARPTPKPPLYKAYPANMVVVCEVGDKYVLTRAGLERIIGDAVKTNEALINKGARVPINPEERDSMLESDDEVDRLIGAERLSQAEDEAMREWVINKALALLAQTKGIRVSEAEVTEQIQKIDRAMSAEGGAAAPAKAMGVSEAAFRDEVRDSIFIDKYIIGEIERNLKEADLQKIHKDNPGYFITPERYHIFQITRGIDPNLTPREVRDLRSAFYDLRKAAARRDGADFEKIAGSETDSEAGRKSGGDMGWVDVNTPLPPELFEAIQKLRVGEVSQIIQIDPKMPEKSLFSGNQSALIQRTVPGAMHIVKLVAKEEAQGVQYDAAAREKVVAMLIERYKAGLGTDFLRKLPFAVRMNATGLRLIHEISQ